MTTPLTGILSPQVRRYIYAAYFLAGVVLGALQIADVDTGKAAEILVYVGAALGLTAASNAPSPESADEGDPPAGEGGSVELLSVLLILTVVNTICVVLLLCRVHLGG